MRAKFNPTGTHIHKGLLKVRVDLYPDVVDKTYPIHWVDKFNREPTEEELADEALLALIPTHKELNPCLCHFIKIDANTSLNSLLQITKEIFDSDTISQLDSLLSSGRNVGGLMRTKCGSGSQVTEEVNLNEINVRFNSLQTEVK